MEGLDDTGGLLADAATHRRQTQALPCAPNGTDASNSAVNDTCVHQQCDSVLAPDTMAHWFDSPHGKAAIFSGFHIMAFGLQSH